MLISRTPLRVSFAGGGTDLPAFASKYGGAVVSCTISKAVYVIVNPRFEDGIRASYTKTEIVESVNDLEHDLIREAIRMVGYLPDGFEIVTVADVPGRGSGLGASSAVTVGCLNALYAYRGLMKTPGELAREASAIEIEILNKPIGRQDQYAVAGGGLQLIRFLENGEVATERIVLPAEALDRMNRSLMLFYTGRQRSADAILRRINPDESQSALRALQMIAEDLFNDLRRGNPDVLGDYLRLGWDVKRNLQGVSDPEIDNLISLGLHAGADGGKLLGAGGGGFLLFHVPPGAAESVRKAMHPLKEMDFTLDHQGARIAFIGS